MITKKTCMCVFGGRGNVYLVVLGWPYDVLIIYTGLCL